MLLRLPIGLEQSRLPSLLWLLAMPRSFAKATAARLANLSPEQRSAQSRKAILKRWSAFRQRQAEAEAERVAIAVAKELLEPSVVRSQRLELSATSYSVRALSKSLRNANQWAGYRVNEDD